MKKEQILNTTLTLIAEHGLHGSPMSLIAKESGVAIGTIYHHYSSKEAIINAIYIQKKQDFKFILDQYLTKDLDIKQKFESIWRAFYQYFIDAPLIFRFTQQIGPSPIITEATKQEGKQYYAPIFDFLSEGISAGLFIEMDVHLMGQLLLGNVTSLVELTLDGVEITSKNIQEAMTYSWRAITK